MIDHLLILLGFAALLALSVPAWRWYVRQRLQAVRQSPLPPGLVALDLPARPVVLYFTTPTCSQCRFQQTPILAGLGAVWGEHVHVRKVDALEQDGLARHYGILTVPSTVVLDDDHQVVAVNHGLAAAERLAAQITPVLMGHGHVQAAPASTLAPLQS